MITPPTPRPLSSPDDGTAFRIVFMGTPQFATPTLQALLSLGEVAGRPSRVVAVVTQPDRPAGRGGHVQAGPVKIAALAAGIPVLQPDRLRRAASITELRSYRPDVIVVAAFGQILSREVLDTPPHGCLNVHASLLPRWRGASPITAALLAGDKETGITIMTMDPGLDTGPILTQQAEPIRQNDTAGTLSARLAVLGADLLTATLGPWTAGTLSPRAQDEAQATLTRPLKRADGQVDWATMPAEVVARMVRAYDPWPTTYTHYANRGLKLWDAEALAVAPRDGTSCPPGHVLTRDEAAPLLQEEDARWPRMLVGTADGLLHVRRVQPEGQRIMGADAFMRGQPGLAGAQLT